MNRKDLQVVEQLLQSCRCPKCGKPLWEIHTARLNIKRHKLQDLLLCESCNFSLNITRVKTVEATLSLLSMNKIPFDEQIGIKVIRQLEQHTGNHYDLLPNGYIAKSYICLKFVQLPDF